MRRYLGRACVTQGGGVGRSEEGGRRLEQRIGALFGLVRIRMNGVRMLKVKIVAAMAAVAHQLLWPKDIAGLWVATGALRADVGVSERVKGYWLRGNLIAQ